MLTEVLMSETIKGKVFETWKLLRNDRGPRWREGWEAKYLTKGLTRLRGYGST